MIKITEDLLKNPYYKEIGSLIVQYPRFGAKPKNIFCLCKGAVEFRIIGYNESRDVINLVSTSPTDSLGVSRLNIPRLDLMNGYWWYDPKKDFSCEIELLFEKFFNM